VRAEEIIEIVEELKCSLKTADPFEIAEVLGIKVNFWDSKMKDFTAQTFKAEGYQTIISIGSKYSNRARKVLCAHELGHAILHTGVNYYKVTEKNVQTMVEYEANLFAVALLFEEEELSIPINKMSNSTLKILLDYNL